MEKKKIKIKNRFISTGIGFLLVFFSIIVVSACRGTSANRVEVRIEIKNPTGINFENFDNIFYKDLDLEWPAKDFSPRKKLREFFVDELSKTIEKDITAISKESSQNNDKTPAKSLLISGKLSLEIKERQKIKEIKDEKGNAKNVFTPIQHWDMSMNLEIVDRNSGKRIFKQNFTEKLNDVDTSETTTKFNFEKLFFKMTNRLLLKIKKTKKMQRRYLLF